ncbi:hypothetical protein ACRQ5D_34015 [Mucilaginibacter sp. P25]|uniref:hypothetical protein n=1 Tax=Mucilaginibacter sp. P25 TaxID=3423945 RepID=UPI003D7ABA23
MNRLLNGLGIPSEIQSFFGIENQLQFDYGSGIETFDAGFHFVPSAHTYYLRVSPVSRKVVVTCSVMEAIAWSFFNLHGYPDMEHYAFIALGNRPDLINFQELTALFPKRKFILVFGRDVLGLATDIFVAAALNRHFPRLVIIGRETIEIRLGERAFRFEEERLSLNAFQKSFGIRTACRTSKSKAYNSYLDQLIASYFPHEL